MKSEQCDTRNPSGKLSFRFWFYLGLAAILLVWSSPADAEEVTVTDSDGSLWTLQINPGIQRSSAVNELLPPLPEPLNVETELASVDQAVLAPVAVAVAVAQDTGIEIRPQMPAASRDGVSYSEIYNSIPYSKTEYYANPSYRHDATMEILFGELRPGGGGRAQGRIIENPVYTPYRPYLNAHWDYFQTSTLLRPRIYRPLYGATFCNGCGGSFVQ